MCGDPQIATVDREASSVLVPWVSSVLRFIPCPWHQGNRAWECAVFRLLTCKIQWTAQLQRPLWDRAAGVPPARDSVMTHHRGDEERQGEEWGFGNKDNLLKGLFALLTAPLPTGRGGGLSTAALVMKPLLLEASA